MNEKQQRRFFFPLWTQSCRALKWRMEDGRLQMAEPKNEHQRKVIAAGEQIALKERRAMVLDDVRHGCYVVALGYDKDTMKLNNREVDAVTSLFKLLVDETNIAADMKLSDPKIGEREALVARINKLGIPFAIIEGVCKRSFAPVYTSPYWDDLPLPNLRALCGILTDIRNRQREVYKQEDAAVAAGHDDEDTF